MPVAAYSSLARDSWRAAPAADSARASAAGRGAPRRGARSRGRRPSRRLRRRVGVWLAAIPALRRVGHEPDDAFLEEHRGDNAEGVGRAACPAVTPLLAG